MNKTARERNMSKKERKEWDALVDKIIEEDKDLLIKIGSERRD